MSVSLRAVPALAVVLLASVFVVADDAQKADTKTSDSAAQPASAGGEGKADSKTTAKSAAQSEARPARQVRLTKPWRDLTSLSDDQKRQINQIHRKAVEDIRAVEQREKEDVLALLSDEQKAEVTALLEKDAAARKARASQQRNARPAARASDNAGGTTPAAEKAEGDSKSAVGSN